MSLSLYIYIIWLSTYLSISILLETIETWTSQDFCKVTVARSWDTEYNDRLLCLFHSLSPMCKGSEDCSSDHEKWWYDKIPVEGGDKD